MSFFRIDRTSNFSESDTKAYFNIQKKRIRYETPYVAYDKAKGIDESTFANKVFTGKQFINYVGRSYPREQLISNQVIFLTGTQYNWMRLCFTISYSESISNNINDTLSNNDTKTPMILSFTDNNNIVEVEILPNVINKRMCVDLYLGKPFIRGPKVNMTLNYSSQTEMHYIKNINFEITYVGFYKKKPGTPI